MRYGSPSIPEGMAALQAQRLRRAFCCVPLYPQYSGSTTATAFDARLGGARAHAQPAGVRSVRDFHDDPGYIDALASRIARTGPGTAARPCSS